MAWGKPSADGNPAAELISKARSYPSLHILPFRAFGDAECVALFAALRGNRTLTELRASGHALGVVSLQALGALLASGDECAIRHLAIGNASLGGAGVSLLCDALGDSRIAILHLGEQRVKLKTDNPIDLREGQVVHLGFAAAAAHLFDRSSGERLN